MVLYHGTSCHSESGIENNGLEWNPNYNIPRNIIDSINDFHNRFNILDWTGGGRNVLATFSRSAFGVDNKSAPICLTNIPERAILYASKDYSGGETVRALRNIYYNLREYIRKPSTRKKYIEYPNHNIDELVNDRQIHEFLEKYKSVFNDAIKKENNHYYGIICAIEFTENDKENLTQLGPINFTYNGCIHNDKIIEMKKISKDIDYNPLKHPFSSVDR